MSVQDILNVKCRVVGINVGKPTFLRHPIRVWEGHVMIVQVMTGYSASNITTLKL